jgi:hypothetical protein
MKRGKGRGALVYILCVTIVMRTTTGRRKKQIESKKIEGEEILELRIELKREIRIQSCFVCVGGGERGCKRKKERGKRR